MKISVIVPVYNVEHFLSECVDSIINQRYNNLEILLIDDGSTDKSGEICDKYSKKDSRIKTIHQSNKGLSGARNAALDIASGDYITFVDSDDIIESDMVSTMVNYIEDGIDIVACQLKRINENGENLKNVVDLNINKKITGTSEIMKAYQVYNDIDTPACGKLYKRSLFDNVRFPENKIHEDVFTTYRILSLCNSLVVLSNSYYGYRVRSNSITQSQFKEKNMDLLEAMIKKNEFIANSFPSLSGYSRSDICYACNQCILKLAESSKINVDLKKKILDQIQSHYRQYGVSYLKSSKKNVLKKTLVLLGVINSKMLYGLLKIWSKYIH